MRTEIALLGIHRTRANMTSRVTAHIKAGVRAVVDYGASRWATNFPVTRRTSAVFLYSNKKGQLSLANPRDACEKFARFT